MKHLIVAVGLLMAVWSVQADEVVFENLNGATRTTIQGHETGNHHVLAYSNGTINVAAATAWFGNTTLHVGDGLDISFNTLSAGAVDGGDEFIIYKGGSLTIKEAYNCRFTTVIDVLEGGTLTTKKANSFGETTGWNTFNLNIEGTYNAELGIGTQKKTFNNAPWNFTLKPSGIINLGGNVSRETSDGGLNLVLAGGTLNVLADSAFLNAPSVSIADGAEPEINVAEGCLADYAAIVYGADSKILKTGSGTLVVSSSPAVEVNDGAIAIAGAGTYDFSKCSFADGTSVSLMANGIVLGGMPSYQPTFTVDVSKIVLGEGLITIADDSLRAEVKGDIVKSLPSGYSCKEEGTTLSVGSEVVFNSTTITDWNNPEAWGGTVPSGVPVIIDGEGVLARISDKIAPVTAILVRNGAKLAVATAIDLPRVDLQDTAEIIFESGSDATLMNGFNVSPIDPSQINTTGSGNIKTAYTGPMPTFTVATNGMVKVPGGMTFNDVKAHLYGSLTVDGSGDLWFGHGTTKVTVFEFEADGATITVPKGSIYWQCQDNSSAHVRLRSVSTNPILIRNTTFPRDADSTGGFEFARNLNWNVCKVIVDGSLIPETGTVLWQNDGYWHMTMRNGARIDRPADGTKTGGFKFGRASTVELYGADTYIRTESFSEVENNQTISLHDNARFGARKFWNIVNLTCDDGVYDVWNWTGTPDRPLNNCTATVAAGKTLTIRSIADEVNPAYDQNVLIADRPIAGEGSLLISNAVPDKAFTATIVNAANTATGTASAADGATLLFADGANWAGTVVSGNVALGGDSAATVSFGGLRLDAPFPIRVWRKDGALVSDCLNIGAGGVSGSSGFSVVLPEKVRMAYGETVKVATVPADTPTPHSATRGFVVTTVPNAQDPSLKDILLMQCMGFSITIY